MGFNGIFDGALKRSLYMMRDLNGNINVFLGKDLLLIVQDHDIKFLMIVWMAMIDNFMPPMLP